MVGGRSRSCAGVRGTRLQEQQRRSRKPLVEIGGRPILWHVIQIYASPGLRRFLLLRGYKGELIEALVDPRLGRRACEIDLRGHRGATRRPGDGSAASARAWAASTFCVTYADGVADIDLVVASRVPPRPWRPARR